MFSFPTENRDPSTSGERIPGPKSEWIRYEEDRPTIAEDALDLEQTARKGERVSMGIDKGHLKGIWPLVQATDELVQNWHDQTLLMLHGSKWVALGHVAVEALQLVVSVGAEDFFMARFAVYRSRERKGYPLTLSEVWASSDIRRELVVGGALPIHGGRGGSSSARSAGRPSGAGSSWSGGGGRGAPGRGEERRPRGNANESLQPAAVVSDCFSASLFVVAADGQTYWLGSIDHTDYGEGGEVPSSTTLINCSAILPPAAFTQDWTGEEKREYEEVAKVFLVVFKGTMSSNVSDSGAGSRHAHRRRWASLHRTVPCRRFSTCHHGSSSVLHNDRRHDDTMTIGVRTYY